MEEVMAILLYIFSQFHALKPEYFSN